MSEPSILETLHSAMIAAEGAGTRLTEFAISDAAAWQLSGELAPMQLKPKTSAADIYLSLKAGTSKVYDLKVSVTE